MKNLEEIKKEIQEIVDKITIDEIEHQLKIEEE